MRVPASPSLRSILEAVSSTVAERPEGGHTMSSEVERAVEFRAVEAMLALAVNPAASSQARAIALAYPRSAEAMEFYSHAAGSSRGIHRAALIDRIETSNVTLTSSSPQNP